MGRLYPGGEGIGGESGTSGKASNMSKSGEAFVAFVNDEEDVETDCHDEGRALDVMTKSGGGDSIVADLLT